MRARKLASLLALYAAPVYLFARALELLAALGVAS